ncbi:hypothetical protein EV356DRAFT_534216 [Viridothelium virens]|uniref:BZIP transcription factor n=1 Tax=Viridothelium virens TaxID=1048519 RepID=A0A6A6H4J5_VIRVR|nr:hypothetical protein EV356DRAFT_534216 [Viridothelium virens]
MSSPIEPPSAMPTVAEPLASPSPSTSSSASSVNEDAPSKNMSVTDSTKLERPKLGTRKSSGTMVIPRDSPHVEIEEEEYDENDARCMSPRRTTEEIERLEKDAHDSLIEQAKILQASLIAIVNKVEAVKSEHEKLEGGNKFLQSYIGELMQTTKITSTGPPKSKGKSRGTK